MHQTRLENTPNLRTQGSTFPCHVWWPHTDVLKYCRSQLTAERPRAHCHAEATTANRTTFPAAFLDGPTQSDFLQDPLVYVPDSYEDTDRTLPIQVLSNQEVSEIYLLPLRSACTLQTRFSLHGWCNLVFSINTSCMRWVQEVTHFYSQTSPACSNVYSNLRLREPEKGHWTLKYLSPCVLVNVEKFNRDQNVECLPPCLLVRLCINEDVIFQEVVIAELRRVISVWEVRELCNTELQVSVQALDAMQDSVHEHALQHYHSFFSSELGGVTTEPAFMQIPLVSGCLFHSHSCHESEIRVFSCIDLQKLRQFPW